MFGNFIGIVFNNNMVVCMCSRIIKEIILASKEIFSILSLKDHTSKMTNKERGSLRFEKRLPESFFYVMIAY